MINSTGLDSPNFHKKKIDAKLDIIPHPVFGAYLTLKKIKIKYDNLYLLILAPVVKELMLLQHFKIISFSDLV